eukprot:7145976-Alexandrium_andersonii.AAC.1
MEHSHSLGMPALNDSIGARPFCFGDPARSDFYSVAGLSSFGLAGRAMHSAPTTGHASSANSK